MEEGERQHPPGGEVEGVEKVRVSIEERRARKAESQPESVLHRTEDPGVGQFSRLAAQVALLFVDCRADATVRVSPSCRFLL